MSSSKRKFQALLNGLGSKSSNSHTEGVNNGSQTALGGRQQLKRLRTGRPGSVASSSITLAAEAKSNMVHRKSSSVATATLSTTDQAPPVAMNDSERQYNPYDREAFLARLKTYSKVLDWADKPTRVDAPEWAKRGWVNKKNERVRCVHCFVEIVVKLHVKEVNGVEENVYVTANIDPALVDRYVEMIVTAHADGCPWKHRGCGDSIFHLTMNPASTMLQKLRSRYDSLTVISDKLPYMHNMHIRTDYRLDEVLAYLPEGFFQSPGDLVDAPLAIDRVAIFLALCGWHGDQDLSPMHGTASCSSCFRNLGLWLFKSKSVDEHGQPVQIATMERLDPVAQHRDYCPWKSGQSQSGPARNADRPLLAAWEILVQSLKNNYYLSTTASNEALPRNSSITIRTEPATVSVDELNPEDEERAREEKDKQRRGRLSKIKSMFDIKGGSKLQKVGSKEAPS